MIIDTCVAKQQRVIENLQTDIYGWLSTVALPRASKLWRGAHDESDKH